MELQWRWDFTEDGASVEDEAKVMMGIKWGWCYSGEWDDSGLVTGQIPLALGGEFMPSGWGKMKKVCGH